MDKSYSQQLEDWIRQHGSSPPERNLVLFLAVRDDVKVALDAGFAVITVWRNMRATGRIDFTYDTFLKYVNRLLRGADRQRYGTTDCPKPASKIDDRKAILKADRVSSNVGGSQPAPGFTFNPSVKKEDLL